MAVHLFVKDSRSGMVDRKPAGGKEGQTKPFRGTESDFQRVPQPKTQEVESVSIASAEGGLDSNSTDEMRRLAVKEVNGRVRWKPGNLLEEEICQVAIERAEHLLQEKKEE